jgi:hypothetical protein
VTVGQDLFKIEPGEGGSGVSYLEFVSFAFQLIMIGHCKNSASPEGRFLETRERTTSKEG